MKMLFCLLGAGLLLAGCGGEKSAGVRKYEEVGGVVLEKAPAAAPGSGMSAAAAPFMNQPAPVVPLGWKAPEGWAEKPGAGVRVASFDAGDGVECAVIAFPAMMAGASVEAKVGIWLQQLGAAAPGQAELVSFVAKPKTIQGAGGVAVDVYDFEDLIGKDVGASMVAGLFKVGEHSLSVRMKGSPKALAGQKEKFRAFCESLVVKKNDP